MKRKNTLHKKKQKSRTLQKGSRIKDKTKKRTRKRVTKKTQSGGTPPLAMLFVGGVALTALLYAIRPFLKTFHALGTKLITGEFPSNNTGEPISEDNPPLDSPLTASTNVTQLGEGEKQ